MPLALSQHKHLREFYNDSGVPIPIACLPDSLRVFSIGVTNINPAILPRGLKEVRRHTTHLSHHFGRFVLLLAHHTPLLCSFFTFRFSIGNTYHENINTYNMTNHLTQASFLTTTLSGLPPGLVTLHVEYDGDIEEDVVMPATITDLDLFISESRVSASTEADTNHRIIFMLSSCSTLNTILAHNTNTDMQHGLTLDKLHLPPSLVTLNLRGYFNASVDNLPPTLESLYVDAGFNQSIDALPASLLRLDLEDAVSTTTYIIYACVL